MSIYYDIKEHLSVKDTDKHEEAIGLAKYQLSLLGAWILQNRAGVVALTVIANGRKYQFEGEVMTKEYHDLIKVFDDAKSLEMEAEYYYIINGGEAAEPGPFAMTAYLGALFEEEPDMQDGIFYSMYNKADCGDGIGTLCAYGQNDDKNYSGVIEPIDAELPETGIWSTRDTSIAFEACATEGMNVEEIHLCAEAITSLGTEADVHFAEDEEGITFFVNHLSLDAKTDFEKYINICRRLIAATNGQVGIMAEFASFDEPDAQTLFIDFNNEDSFAVKRATI